ncbi:endolytic transglycosylase MltG [Streptomyces sp. DH37]|uniref:endolytic transglycosylase MltG n=1 Tax=Streptomyces sp. DH37 TaxID=3040122 RepID=UPI002442B537|nr:endolytic transglycosylase MltG [Streptomyces sp. DH37]MDG9704894.1 endolytic transglycosylase MltG [Streptomyces sp. DH37]
MTEYGRGTGSEPWHPDDPLYGDQGWNGARHEAQHGDWDTYGGQGQYPPQQHPQQHQGHQSSSGYGGQEWETQGGGQPYGHQQRYGDPYGHQQGRDDPYGHQQGQGDPYGHQQDQGDPYGDPYGHQQQYGDPYGHQQGQGDPYGHQQGQDDPYGHQQHADPYGDQQQYAGHADHADHTGRPGAQDAHGRHHEQEPSHPPQHQRQGRRRDEPDPGPGPDEETGWDPGPDQGEHAFFSDDGDDGHADDGDDRPGRRNKGKGKGGRKGRNGFACLTVAVVLVGGVGTAGYFVHDFYQSHFAAAPDFSGQGSGETQVEIPEGSTLAQMGALLKKAGVVKSQEGFVEASRANPRAESIQPGVYMLRKEMSSAAAIEMMLDPSSQNALIIAEGKRSSEIYALIDEKLGLAEGTTEKAAENTDLGLPEWAKGNPEGFLFPAKYTVGDKTKPEDLLRKMVERAEREFAKIDLEAQAAKVDKTPYEVVIIASLIQAEAQEDDEFGKVSRVIYNRLDPGNTATNGRLEFDSTINYAMGRSTLDVSLEDTDLDSPYNTYRNKGLPPGPIDNPGHQAFEAALNPTEGGWLYFVTVRPGDTRFSEDIEEHNRHVEEFNAEQKKNRENQ